MNEIIQADVCVMGAGPVGGTIACRLAAAGVRVAVVDQAPLPPMEHPAFDGRAYAIAAGSKALLVESGLWDALPDAPSPILRFVDNTGRWCRHNQNPSSNCCRAFSEILGASNQYSSSSGPISVRTTCRNHSRASLMGLPKWGVT